MSNSNFLGVTRSFLRWVMVTAVATMVTALSVDRVSAQQPAQQPRAQGPRRQATIEIRGQVPTPQVVTVRPRETPAYSRRVLVPAFFDHDFWPSILPPLEIVSPLAGTPEAIRSDTTSRSAADSAARARSPTRPPSGTPPAPLRR